MRKIIIKLPDPRVKKFRLQREGWKSLRFLRASSILNVLDRRFPRKGLEEKTSIMVKEYIPGHHGHFENVNETLASKHGEYLFYATSCFLEDYLSDEILSRAEKRWTKDYFAQGPEWQAGDETVMNTK